MKAYCLKCRKDTEYINPKVLGNSNGKATILSKCAEIEGKIPIMIGLATNAALTCWQLHLLLAI